MLDPDNLNPSVRFFWPESDNEEWVDFRVAAQEDLVTIRKKLGIKEKAFHVINPETRAVNRVIGSNVEENEEKKQLITDELTDFCITDWSLLAPDGTEIPCTRENKIKFMNKSPVFAKWAADCLNEIRTGEKAQSEAEIKN